MAKFLTARATTAEIENIINNAVKGVIFISPFIKITDSLFQNIQAADQRGIKTKIIYGKKELELTTREQLKQLKNNKLYFLDNLHAKCYFNEQKMIITSLNLYGFSDKNNREMGVLIDKNEDNDVFTEAVREVELIYSLAARTD